jgi:hypothetical protein
MNLISMVSGPQKFPKAWVTALRATRGVYVLTIAFTGFKKYRDIGRYGLFPPLPE